MSTISALACQSLPHYSDFDTTSESGLSDLSYVLPYRPKKPLTRNKPVKTGPGEIRLGARAMRRYENEVYLNTLAVITETDGDNVDDYWSESFNYCSTFTKLLEDQNIRAAWDAFIQLSEKEQEKLLGTLRVKNKIDDDDISGSDDYDIEDDVISSYPSAIHHTSSSLSHPKHHVKHRCRRSKREERKKRFDDVNSLLQSNLNVCVPVQSEDNNNVTKDDSHDLEIEQRIPTRVLSVVSDSVTPNMMTMKNLKHSRKRCKRLLTPTDICLLQRVEVELRQHFFSQTNSNRIAGRWTPSLSLLSQSMSPSMTNNCTNNDKNYYSHSNLLCLDPFQRLLVHSIASYLGLNSYSTWSNSLGERQLWVEQILGKCSQPPKQHFVTLIEQKITQSSSKSLNT
ncbi:hypothetical protein Smp_194680 [Schistosoma mansoni]|uniref:hypothetical protein n=1 Tax=Schistosoma mansoni TaxID=6183 RepID=UPI0001A625BE|nr:hypothetical protein Smp_194680 [Schistosoma mansoni]|eukprot:XP_018650681.1 hypothetical protein Smp_194680 [Schistosoma mansoni]